MKVSVVIPTYNSAATIEAAVDSVLAQTATPDEILIMDDGSSDHTLQRLARYGNRITVLQQPNQGVAPARNALCRQAGGDLVAFLDHDDIWHPEYLAAQKRLVEAHPEGAAFFTGHENFRGYEAYHWNASRPGPMDSIQVIDSLRFLKWYHRNPGPFVSMSFCCVPQNKLRALGPAPFCPEVSGVDDSHLLHLLLLQGPIIYNARPLAAYRLTQGAQSANLLKAVLLAVRSLELLSPQFDHQPDPAMAGTFRTVFAGQRRECAKILMGAGRFTEARQQLRLSLKTSLNPASWIKGVLLLFLAILPGRLQPRWPSEWKTSHSVKM